MLRTFLTSIILFSISAQAGNRVVLASGLNYSDFSMDMPSGSREPKQEVLMGYNIMVGFQHPLSQNTAIVIGIGQETRGAILKEGLSYPSELRQGTIRLNYVHIPLLLKMYSPGSGVKAYLCPGVELGVLGNAESESIYDEWKRHLDAAGKLDLDLGASVGVEVPLMDKGIFIEGGYAYGLLNSNTSDTRISVHNTNIRLRIGLYVGR
jgi:Outer membrane protein beta-barrel domain